MTEPKPLDPQRYPTGRFERNPSTEQLPNFLQAIRLLPAELGAALQGLNNTQLDTPYREGGWTLRQVAHHVADSHTNAWLRLKLALTTEWPTILPYDEKLWARTAECRGPVDAPLMQLSALHTRMHALLASLDAEDWARGYRHPVDGPITLLQMAALYGWHGRHHTAHVYGLRQRMGW